MSMIKTTIAAFVLVAFASPVLADEYFVVQDVQTKKCTITHERPTTSTTVIVGGSGMTFKSETEAQTGMKTIKECVQQ